MLFASLKFALVLSWYCSYLAVDLVGPRSSHRHSIIVSFYCHVLLFTHRSCWWQQARRFYESALRLEPEYLGAVLALADLHGMEGRNEEAITLLQRYLKNWADDALHTKLAQILAATEKLGESLSHYQTALRWGQSQTFIFFQLWISV